MKKIKCKKCKNLIIGKDFNAKDYDGEEFCLCDDDKNE